jgi:hypothetical protein
MRAGLIPSRMLQEKRIAYERAHSANNNADQQGESLLFIAMVIDFFLNEKGQKSYEKDLAWCTK